ncbi:NADPH-dependent oxidoreductase [Clostridiisalibacter paucivorans]|uniref:NADPH-dependent oxidoreductase n=1 Tax=Clostridiisalibacter paucivorans TaxID=408753 RepID=UPI00047CE940|nr:NADPH-dependent oxidoreductase [Clostridiisalibacter paucivorans]
MNHIYEVISNHVSIRKYKDEDIREGDLNKILKSTQFAPSSINGQQWSVIVIKNKETKKKIADLTGGQRWIAEAPVFLVFVADYYRTALALNKENKEFKNIESIEATMVSSVDIGIAFSNAMNVAESMGYGIVPIGAVRREPMEIVKLLDLPKYVYPVLGMCIGIPDEKPMKKPRLPEEAVIHNEKYNRNLQDLVNQYDKTIKEYMDTRTQGKDVRTWSQGISSVYDKVYFPKVYPSLKEQGFTNNK